jgi:hypothetical protein
MPSKPLDLPIDVAKAFIKDMRAFFAAGGTEALLSGRPRGRPPFRGDFAKVVASPAMHLDSG